jgi:hypothetical protein
MRDERKKNPCILLTYTIKVMSGQQPKNRYHPVHLFLQLNHEKKKQVPNQNILRRQGLKHPRHIFTATKKKGEKHYYLGVPYM